MATTPDHISMALFCDFENVALGVRDANYDKFDIKRVLERLLLKGSIVVKKAYCDWDRYKGFKAGMHEANFELIEIPHVRQSGKNSADIRLVVDALDLCYTKSHVNTFVIISGDSDFSPLVSKLRENAKYVIGVGIKQSTSDLLTANCDEFIFYDDLVREQQRVDARRGNRNNQPAAKRTPEEEQHRRAELDVRRSKAVEMAVETYEALVTDRDEGGKIWASVLKEAIKRRNPGFNENYYGFRTFSSLLEEAKARGMLEYGRDDKSSSYVYRSSLPTLALDAMPAEFAGSNASYAQEPPSASSELNAHAHDAGGLRSPPEEREAAAGSESPNSPARETGSRSRRGARGRGRDRDRGDRGDRAERDRSGSLSEDKASVEAPSAPEPSPQPAPVPQAAKPRAAERPPAQAPAPRPTRGRTQTSTRAPAPEPVPAAALAPAPLAAPGDQAEATAAPPPAARKRAPAKKVAKKAAARPRAARKTPSAEPDKE